MPPMLSRLQMDTKRLRPPRARQLLVAASLCTCVVLAAGMIWFAVSSRQAAIDDAVREMRNDCPHARRGRGSAAAGGRRVQLGLIEHMRGIGVDSPETFAQLMATQAVQQDLSDRIAGLPYVAALLLFDRHGELLNFSRAWPPPPLNGADRDFIRDMGGRRRAEDIHQRAVARQGHRPRGRSISAAGSRPPTGSLLGFVVSTIEIDYFERIYARLPLTGGGAFALYRRDGMLLARYPHARSARSAGRSPRRRISAACSARWMMAWSGRTAASMARTG